MTIPKLYAVENRTLKQAVRRNEDRFPNDFMFRLTKDEANDLISIGVSQFVIPQGITQAVLRCLRLLNRVFLCWLRC